MRPAGAAVAVEGAVDTDYRERWPLSFLASHRHCILLVSWRGGAACRVPARSPVPLGRWLPWGTWRRVVDGSGSARWSRRYTRWIVVLSSSRGEGRRDRAVMGLLSPAQTGHGSIAPLHVVYTHS
jgi:hypothetical protein